MNEITRLEINKLQLKPGDILCFRFPKTISEIDVKHFQRGLLDSEIIPNGIGVLFLANGVEISVVEASRKEEMEIVIE